MSNVVSFPERRRVEISYGQMVRAVVLDQCGWRPDYIPGSHQFFVEAIEPDSVTVMWSGDSYDEAIRQAHELGPEFGPVIDQVVTTPSDPRGAA